MEMLLKINTNIRASFLCIVLFVSFTSRNSQKSNNCKGDFNLNSLELNHKKIFKLKKQEIIELFNLIKVDNNLSVEEYSKGGNYFLINSSEEIVSFSLIDSTFTLTSPNINIGIKESVIEKKFPKNYKKKSKDEYYNVEMESVSLYDCNNNELRLFIYKNKLHHILYLSYEDSEDWGNEN